MIVLKFSFLSVGGENLIFKLKIENENETRVKRPHILMIQKIIHNPCRFLSNENPKPDCSGDAKNKPHRFLQIKIPSLAGSGDAKNKPYRFIAI